VWCVKGKRRVVNILFVKVVRRIARDGICAPGLARGPCPYQEVGKLYSLRGVAPLVRGPIALAATGIA
jgi:hypothetical protein